MRKILNQIAMPRAFVVIVVPLFIVGFILAEFVVLGQAFRDTHADTKRDALMVEQLLQKQTRQLTPQDSDADLSHKLELEDLSGLDNLNVNFVAEDGRVLDSNHPEVSNEPGLLARLVTWLLDKPPAMVSIVEPVTVDDQLIGNIIIKNNFNNELQDVGHEAAEVALPWLLLFVLSGFALAQLLMAILTRIEPLLTGRQKTGPMSSAATSTMNLKTVFSLRHLSIRLTEAIDGLRNMMHLQNRKVVEAQEIERKRLAAELHDELGQHLTAMRFELDKICFSEDPDKIKNTAEALRQRSERMSDILRSNLEQLRPPQLEQYGLSACLEQLVHDWQFRHPDNPLSFSNAAEHDRLDKHSQLTAYRIVQECLTNISRHAGEGVHVEVQLFNQSGQCVIEVSDNGKGCDMQTLHGRYGLLGMRERVDALSGALLINSREGQGMQVKAMLPVLLEN